MIRLSAFADEANAAVEGQIAALKRNNIPYIELRGLDGVNIRNITIDQATAYAKRYADAGIRVWSIGSPIGKMAITDDFEKEKEDLRHLCKLAKIFGTDKLRIFSFYKAYEDEPKVLDYLKQMVAIAQEEGCTLYHENEKQIFGDTAERVERLMEQVNGLKFIYDPANFIEVGEEPKKTISALQDRCAYFHIKDALMGTGEIVPAGLGDGKIPEMIANIPANADITLTLEPHLAIFKGYAEIDSTQLKNKYCYATNEEAFDAAVAALKKILINEGYIECEGGYKKQ